MRTISNRIPWVFILGLIAGLAMTSLAHAGQPKDKDADVKQSTQEDADEDAARQQGVKNRDRRTFLGRFDANQDSTEEHAPDVVGTFITSAADKKPNHMYLVKAESGNMAIVKALMRYNGKNTQVLGKLRVLDENGEGKYLIVNSVIEAAPTPHIGERRKPGNI